MDDTLPRTEEQLSDADDILQMIGFVIADELFCVDILIVQEIIKEASITAIPDAPDFIMGVINLRGNIIPVIDLSKRLSLSRADSSVSSGGWILILRISGRVTGFVVDRVTRVLKIPEGAVKPPPEMGVAGLKNQYVSGICKHDQQLLAILDFNRILAVDEFKKISAMKRQ
jgi:purine-binding chemotaxis protein CheW